MKLKYYLRGLGIGILVTTIILMISFSQRETTISDDEVIARAMQLGMVMPEEDVKETEQETTETTEPETQASIAEPKQEMPVAKPEQEADVTEQEPVTQLPEEQDVADVPDGTYRLTIQKGDVCRIVCENLAANGVIEDAEALRKYLFEIGYASKMSTGEYDIAYGLTLEEVAQVLMAGPIE